MGGWSHSPLGGRGREEQCTEKEEWVQRHWGLPEPPERQQQGGPKLAGGRLAMPRGTSLLQDVVAVLKGSQSKLLL